MFTSYHKTSLTLERFEIFEHGKCYTSEDSVSLPSLAKKAMASCSVFDLQGHSLAAYELGPTWSVHLIRASAVIPLEWGACNGCSIQFHFDFEGEALLVDEDNRPVQALTAQEQVRPVAVDKSSCGRSVDFLIEAACHEVFGAGKGGMIRPPDPCRTFKIKRCELVLVDDDISALHDEFVLVADIARHFPKDSQIAVNAMEAANRAMNIFRAGSPAATREARKILEGVLPLNGASLPRDHTLFAVGHCHIDTAWLWRYEVFNSHLFLFLTPQQTRRKCVRSWTSQLALMNEFDEFVFTASQAQQFEWVKQDEPALFARIQRAAQSGRFVPTGLAVP
jgi:alpha-mannosidase